MKSPEDLELNLLLFSVGGVHFGIHAGQVSEMRAYRGERGDDLFWFHEHLPCGDRALPCALPTVITIQSEQERSFRVIVDRMEDMGLFALSEIRLFPPLVEPFALSCGLWGVLPRPGKLVFLLDVERWLPGKRGAGGFLGNREPAMPPT
jgi:chemotaxis signal transduction protein